MNQTAQQLTDTHSQLAAARNILAATGKSPRQLGDESRRKVIEWLYHWGYTSSTLIQLLLDRTSGGYAQKLAKQGWLTATKTVSGSPTAYFTLTEQGLQEAERISCALYRYSEIDNYKVNQQQIRHYLIAQAATLNGLHAVIIARYETERMFAQSGDKPGVKRPDVVWHTQAGLKIAVKIELTAKWGRDLDEFVLAIGRALQSTENRCASYSRFAIISDSPAIIERYQIADAPQKYGTERPLKKEAQIALWLCLGTICRIGELLMTEWKHVNFEQRTWFIPAANTKGERGRKCDQLVYLSDFTLDQFKQLHALTGDSEWAFPARYKEGHV